MYTIICSNHPDIQIIHVAHDKLSELLPDTELITCESRIDISSRTTRLPIVPAANLSTPIIVSNYLIKNIGFWIYPNPELSSKIDCIFTQGDAGRISNDDDKALLVLVGYSKHRADIEYGIDPMTSDSFDHMLRTKNNGM